MIDRFMSAKELGAQLRVDSIRCTTAAGSGHPTSSMSAADLMAVLLLNHLRYDWQNPQALNNDRLIFSKGHASPLLYSMYKAAGVIGDSELLSLRKLGSRLEGHPKPSRGDSGHGLPWVDVATGSLGQGLPAGVGMGLVAKRDGLPFRIWVLLGDSEMAEGSVWEAFDKAGHYALGNLIAILDMNRLGQRGPTELGWDSAVYADRARSFGCQAIEIDGHDLASIDAAYKQALHHKEKPTLIVAKTIKGSGVTLVADKEGWHGTALSEEQAASAISELGGERSMSVTTQRPENFGMAAPLERKAANLPTYNFQTEESTRKAFGSALDALGASTPELVVLDGEVSNSTYTDEFKQAYPDRFYEMFIAEQQMVSAALGMSTLGKKPVVATFAAFLTRAYDQIRMASVSGATLGLCGSHVGVSIGEDGPSQMGLEDIAMMRAVHGSTILYPCDPNQTVRLTKQMLETSGITYIRTTRGKLPVIYSPDVSFQIGGSNVLRYSADDVVTVVAAGITVHAALAAYETLREEGTRVRVIDAYSIKPIDRDTLKWASRETEALLVVEDHYAEGGLGDAVLDALADTPGAVSDVVKLAVRRIPGSATPDEQLYEAGIDATHIVQAARSALQRASRSVATLI